MVNAIFVFTVSYIVLSLLSGVISLELKISPFDVSQRVGISLMITLIASFIGDFFRKPGV